jgi:hypothetical protein
LNSAYWGSNRKNLQRDLNSFFRDFIAPEVSSKLFLHDLTIAYRKSREIVEIVGLAEKGKG